MVLTTAQRRMLVIGLVPLLLLVLGGAAVTVSAIRGKLPYDYSAEFVPGERGVSVVSDVPVDVTSSPDGQVHVNVDGSYAAQQPAVNVTPTEGLLEVRTSCPGRGKRRLDRSHESPEQPSVGRLQPGLGRDGVRQPAEPGHGHLN